MAFDQSFDHLKQERNLIFKKWIIQSQQNLRIKNPKITEHHKMFADSVFPGLPCVKSDPSNRKSHRAIFHVFEAVEDGLGGHRAFQRDGHGDEMLLLEPKKDYLNTCKHKHFAVFVVFGGEKGFVKRQPAL